MATPTLFALSEKCIPPTLMLNCPPVPTPRLASERCQRRTTAPRRRDGDSIAEARRALPLHDQLTHNGLKRGEHFDTHLGRLSYYTLREREREFSTCHSSLFCGSVSTNTCQPLFYQFNSIQFQQREKLKNLELNLKE